MWPVLIGEGGRPARRRTPRAESRDHSSMAAQAGARHSAAIMWPTRANVTSVAWDRRSRWRTTRSTATVPLTAGHTNGEASTSPSACSGRPAGDGQGHGAAQGLAGQQHRAPAGQGAHPRHARPPPAARARRSRSRPRRLPQRRSPSDPWATIDRVWVRKRSSSWGPGSTTSRTSLCPSRATASSSSPDCPARASRAWPSTPSTPRASAAMSRACRAYARQFLGQMNKPDVDSIEGLSPAISIDQKTTSRNPRSTVGTVTEVYDYLRLLYARIGHPHCWICGRPIEGQSKEQIVDQILGLEPGTRFVVKAPVVRGQKGWHKEVLEHIRQEGFTRVEIDGRAVHHGRGAARAGQERAPRHQHRGRPPGDEGGHPAPALRLGGDRAVRGPRAAGGRRVRRAGTRRPAATRTAGPRAAPHQPALLREPGLSGARGVAARDGAAHLLVQLPARRLRDLQRAGRPAGDRPGCWWSAIPSLSVEEGVLLPWSGSSSQVLRPDHQGHRRALRGGHVHALGRAARGGAGHLPLRHAGASGSTSPTSTGPGSSAAT